MTRTRPFEAVISDMDGVLTRTARLHERAWKRMFDGFLQQYEGQRPFSAADYRAHVDGKPRYDGAADFLASRRIELPRGQPADAPDARTICGLGNRKNAYFLELLASDRIDVFDDAIAAIDRWRRGGLKLAAVSGSRNCRHVLRAVGLEHRFDVIVDGLLGQELHLKGKSEIMLEAARRLGVAPADALVLEDATAGVRAGRRDGFGLVVGVSRVGNEQDLRAAGAEVVTSDVFRVRFLRQIPNALDRLTELSAWRGVRRLVIFLDYDGTLTPIVNRPEDAVMSDATRSVVRELARHSPVAIVSGRDREDLERRVGIEGLFYAGNHGFDIAGRGLTRTLPDAEQALDEVARATKELEQRVGCLAGVLIERKRFSVAVHYREVDSKAALTQVARAVDAIREKTGLRERTGKKVLELEPAVDWNKGRALRWLIDVLPNARTEDSFALYIGDDETDEDAFAALAGTGAGVRVGQAITTSLADYCLEGPDAVGCYLQRLTASMTSEAVDVPESC